MTKRQRANLILKIIGTVIYVLITAFLMIMFFSVLKDKNENLNGWALGAAISLIITMIVSIGYILPIGLGILGLIILKKIEKKQSKAYFIFMIIVPLLTVVLNYLSYYFITLNN